MKFMEAAKGTHLCRSSSDRLEAHGAPDLKPGLAENPQGYHASIEPIPKIPREFPQISRQSFYFKGNVGNISISRSTWIHDSSLRAPFKFSGRFPMHLDLIESNA